MTQTQKTLTTALMMIAVSFTAALALPTIRITTSDGSEPPAGTLVGDSKHNNSPAFNFQYVSMSKFELTDPDNSANNVTRNNPLDSVRQRGNSTANVDMPKKPYRIKFDQKVPLFGKPAAKSWVLLANHMDKTFAMNALAFRLGRIIGLEFTPTFQFVNLEICGPNGTCAKKGIYQLTEQVQVNPGRVDIDEDRGWLVEFNFHQADNNDIMFETGMFDNLKVFIKSPEIDDADYTGSSASSYPQLAFVREEFMAVLNTLADAARFQAGAHRDMIDLTSFAKYVFVQQFMANFEWVTFGYVASNFAYKNIGERMKAGPLWDFDLATGTLNQGPNITTTYSFLSNTSSSQSILPPRTSMYGSTQNAFYRELLKDEVFRARYRKAWEENKDDILALAAPGGFIDSIAGLLRDHIAANYAPYQSVTAPPPNSAGCFVACGVKGSGPSSAAEYDQEIAKLKTWWNSRHSYWNTEIVKTITYGSRTYTFNASDDVEDNILPAMRVIKVGRTPNTGGTVTLAIGGADPIENPGGHYYAAEGTSVTITSSANTSAGYRFTGWTAQPGTSLPPGVDASKDTVTFTVSGNMDVKANYELTLSVGGAARWTFVGGSRVAVARGGLRINVVDRAVVRIYGLDGRQVRRVDLARGDHHLRLGDLPGGLYVAQVSADGQVRALRIPVR